MNICHEKTVMEFERIDNCIQEAKEWAKKVLQYIENPSDEVKAWLDAVYEVNGYVKDLVLTSPVSDVVETLLFREGVRGVSDQRMDGLYQQDPARLIVRKIYTPGLLGRKYKIVKYGTRRLKFIKSY